MFEPVSIQILCSYGRYSGLLSVLRKALNILNTMLHIKSVQYLADFKIWVSFDDGTAGEVDLKDSLNVPVFKALKKLRYSQRCQLTLS